MTAEDVSFCRGLMGVVVVAIVGCSAESDHGF